MIHSKPFQICIWILLLFLIILVGKQISFIFRPIVVLITTIFFPVLISGALYYLLNPIVKLLVKKKISKTAAILLIYLLIILLIVVAVLYLGPIIQYQVTNLIEHTPAILTQFHNKLIEFQEDTIFSRFEETDSFLEWREMDIASLVEDAVTSLVNNFAFLVSFFTNIIIVLATIPFILFYMLKDGHKLPYAIVKILPEKYQEEGIQILAQMSNALSSFIQGQLIVSLFVGILVFIAYLIIGLDYALILALIALVTNVIPYFGPVIGIIPGLIVGLINSPWTALQVLIAVFIIQQLESQLVSPQVLGKKLAIHPITIIFILLTAGSLAGILGMLLAVPAYAVIKVVVVHLYYFIKLRLSENEKEKQGLS